MRPYYIVIVFLLLLPALLLAACFSPVDRTVVNLTPIPGPAGMSPRKIALKAVIQDASRKELAGRQSLGIICMPYGPMRVGLARFNLGRSVLDGIFRSVLRDNRYRTVSLSSDFGDAEPAADYTVTAYVKSIRADICYPQSGAGNYLSAKGSGYVKVEWRFHRKDGSPAYSTVTEGMARLDERRPNGASWIMKEAFAAAITNLLADPNFYAMVKQ